MADTNIKNVPKVKLEEIMTAAAALIAATEGASTVPEVRTVTYRVECLMTACRTELLARTFR